jgi:hypothetical protein
MKINYGKISRLLLMCLVILLLLMVTAHANESVSLKFNSHELQADVYVKEGVSYISAQSLMKIPGIEVEEEGYIPLRKFFETGAGIVHYQSPIADRKRMRHLPQPLLRTASCCLPKPG